MNENPPQVTDLKEAQLLINKLWVTTHSLTEKIHSLEKKIKEQKGKLSKNSKNSSKPPSTDGYNKPNPKSQRKPSNRPSGGQPGHKGSTLKKVDKPDTVEVYPLDTCSHCSASLDEAPVLATEGRQVFDLPNVALHVIEHQVEVKQCACCGEKSKSEFPKNVTNHTQYGTNTQAIITYYSQYQLLPYKRIQEMFKDIFNVNLSQGTIKNVLSRGSDGLDEFMTQTKEALLNSPVNHFDETGMRVDTDLHWLHVASNEAFTYYFLHKNRGRIAIDEMGILPDYQGYAMHDHWVSYYTYLDCEHLLCNAHHLRELTYASEQYEQAWPTELIQCLVDIKIAVAEVLDKGLTSLSEEQLKQFNQQYDEILAKGKGEIPILPKTKKKKKGKAKRHKSHNLHARLVEHKAEVLGFMNNLFLPFDNNLAERDIRMAKLKQKISGCFRTEDGGDIFSRLRSYISTVRKQDINQFDALINLFNNEPFVPTVNSP
jgi:transposase